MEFNKIASNMTFLGCVIRELNISNQLISISENVKKGFNMDVDVKDITCEDDSGERLGKVTLDIVVETKKDEEKNGEIYLKLEGGFAASPDVAEDDFKKMLLLNGATALYSIARGKIESITANVYQNGKITMPMINMYEFYKEKANED